MRTHFNYLFVTVSQHSSICRVRNRFRHRFYAILLHIFRLSESDRSHQLRTTSIMFEAVYIADGQGNLVHEYLVLPSAPSFSSFSNSINSKHGGFDSDEPYQVIELNERYYASIHHTKYLKYALLCLKEGEYGENPLTPFVFLERLVETMHEYFGSPLTATKIDANNDTLTLLLNEMIYNGLPNTTDSNKLRELVLLKSLLSKILSTSNELAAAATNKSLASLSSMAHAPRTEESIPWRKSNVRYTNNEVFIDVIEEVNVILKPKTAREGGSSARNFDSAFYSNSFSGAALVPVTGTISGKIDCLCHISGVPLLQVDFNSAAVSIDVPLFHSCIKVDTWLKSKSLSFIPPDGQSTLMTYLVDMDTLLEKAQLGMLGLVEFECQLQLGSGKNEFELRCKVPIHNAISKIENLSIEIFSEMPQLSRNDDGNSLVDGVINMKSIRATHGDFRYHGDGRAEWTMKELKTGSQPVLRGSITTSALQEDSMSTEQAYDEEQDSDDVPNQRPISPLYYKVTYTYKGAVPSGLKVDSLKVTSIRGLGDNVKPFKGVRYITKTGDYTIRAK